MCHMLLDKVTLLGLRANVLHPSYVVFYGCHSMQRPDNFLGFRAAMEPWQHGVMTQWQVLHPIKLSGPSVSLQE